MLLPIVTSLIYRDGLARRFHLRGASVCLVAGAVIAAGDAQPQRELRSRDGFLLVTLAWVLMSAIADSAAAARRCRA